MRATKDRLFTPRFFLMCGFSFTAFLSAFQLFPTAPFHIRDLGGSTFASGLFLAALTFASAASAPFTGALADRFGLRRTLVTSGLAITVVRGRLRLGARLPPDARPHRAARALLVGAADGVGGLHEQHPPGVAPGRGHQLLGAVVGARPGRRADGGLLGLPARLGDALPRDGRAQSGDGRHRVAPARRARPRAARARAARRARSSSGASWCSRARCCSTRTATAPSPVSRPCTPRRTASCPRASTSAWSGWRSSRRGRSSARLGDRVGYVRILVPCLGLISVGLLALVAGGTRGWQVASAIVFGDGIRNGVSDLRGLHPAPRQRRAARRRVRRHHRRVRHRHRRRLAADGLVRRAVGLPGRLRGRRRPLRPRHPVLLQRPPRPARERRLRLTSGRLLRAVRVDDADGDRPAASRPRRLPTTRGLRGTRPGASGPEAARSPGTHSQAGAGPGGTASYSWQPPCVRG